MANYKIYIDTFELISTTEPAKPLDRITDLDVFMTYRLGRVGDLENRERPFPLISYETDDLREAEKEMDWNVRHYPLTTSSFDGLFHFLRGRLCWLEDEDGNVLDYGAMPYA